MSGISSDSNNSDARDLLAEINNPITAHSRRAIIGDQLASLGDPRPGAGLRSDGVPDIEWCKVPAGEVVLEKETFAVKAFYIAKYPITYGQFQSFVEDEENGFSNKRWWKGLASYIEKPDAQPFPIPNHPRVNVSWYEAVVFCRWLSALLGYEVRLPTEWEWQLAANGGAFDNIYPWGPKWDQNHANTKESGLGRILAVGMYPQGKTITGAFDMCGNIWEWCLNDHAEKVINLDSIGNKAIRGGSWDQAHERATTNFREHFGLAFWDDDLGFRLCTLNPK